MILEFLVSSQEEKTPRSTDVIFRVYFEGSQRIANRIEKKQKALSERGRSFLIGLCCQLYPLLDIECSKKACTQDIWANSCWLFEGSKTYGLFCFLQAVAKSTANYSKTLRTEPLEQSMVNLLYLASSTRILLRKLLTSWSC